MLRFSTHKFSRYLSRCDKNCNRIPSKSTFIKNPRKKNEILDEITKESRKTKKTSEIDCFQITMKSDGNPAKISQNPIRSDFPARKCTATKIR